MSSYRLGFDIGGTFTDVIAIAEETGQIEVVKCPTTPRDPSLGVINGITSIFEKLHISGAQVSFAVHSTTLVTNTVIERKGAKTALMTTKGFKDILEIGREKRITIYDIFEDRLKPIVPRHLRFEISERLHHDGRVEKKIDEREVARVVRRLLYDGVESVAVCFLHAYSNPSHEKRAKRILEKLAPLMTVSISSEIIPEWREYERSSATVINAYTQPKTAEYMRKIENVLRSRGFGGKLFIMQSSGGLMTVDNASDFPVKIIESGPAAGVLAAAYLGKLSASENMISFDMGGTTAKCCLILKGVPRVTNDFEIAGYMYLKGSGYPVRIPTIDLLEIGAGGGSIAHIDYGLMKVGPASAGADPGPACYPSGGSEPTVTDADLVLGYLNPDYFLGGDIKLDKQKSVKVIAEKIASPLGVGVEQAASGIYNVVNSNMSRAMRVISIERGQDPAFFSLVAFGGAGPVHATRLSRELKVKKVIVPLAAGVTSALGLLVADMRFDFVKTYVTRIDKADVRVISELFESMKEEADILLSATDYRKTYIKAADIRYSGQAFEMTVPFGEGFDKFDLSALKEEFLRLYQNRYGYTTNDPIECVNWRLVALGVVPKVSPEKYEGIGLRKGPMQTDIRESKDYIKGKRFAYYPEGGFVETLVYDRYKLFKGSTFEGPAIVEERESTCVVAPKQQVYVDQYLNLIITEPDGAS